MERATIVPPVPGPSLRRNFVWNLAGGGAFVAGQWAILVALTKIGDEATAADNLGRFALSLVVLQPLVQVAHAELRQVQATDARRRRPPGLYLGARGLAVAAVLAVVAVLGAIWGRPAAATHTLFALALAKGFESCSDVTYGRFEQRERMDLVARSQLLRAVVGLAAFTAALAGSRDVTWAGLALAGAWGLVFAAHDLPLSLRRDGADPAGRPPLSLRACAGLLWVSFPLGITTGLAALAINTPPYVIEARASTELVGRYAALAYFVSALRMPAIAAGVALAPRLGRHLARGNLVRARRLSAALVLACAAPGLAGTAAAALFGRPLLALVYRPSFAAFAPELTVLLAAATVGFAAYGLRLSLTAAGRYASQIPPVLGMLAVTAAVAWVLVPTHGVLGAAVGLLCGRLVQFFVFALTYAAHLAGLAQRAPAPAAPPAE